MATTIKKGFGPQKQEIDLKNYENRWSEEEIQSHSKRGTFIRFAFLDLNKFGGDLFHEELINLAIREDGSRGNVDRDIAYSYETKGWSYNPFPPIVDTSFKVKDGRTRIRAAMIAGCTFIVVAAPAALVRGAVLDVLHAAEGAAETGLAVHNEGRQAVSLWTEAVQLWRNLASSFHRRRRRWRRRGAGRLFKYFPR